MLPYIELHAHHIGKSHVQNGLACEDYSASYADDQVSIIVISDGHGDKNCFRSAKGARYACETAISLCRRFQSITSHIDDIACCDFETLIVSLESDIAEAWKEQVLSDAAANPFLEEELELASEQAQRTYRSGQRHEKAYGCTLIVSMSTVNYWLSLQIGDGKSVAAYSDGVFVEPVPADDNCLGNRSTSLCSSNAKEAFRHYFSKVKPLAAFVSSDGVEESFDQAGLYNFFYSVAYWLKEEGAEAAQAKLDGLLPQISEGGSGDDVSVAVMVSTEAVITKPRQTLDQIYERVSACENALEQCQNLLADTNDRISEKSKACAALEKEIIKLETELEEKQTLHAQLLTELEELHQSAVELDAKANRALEQTEKASRYKASAERFWFAEFEKIDLKYRPPAEDMPQDDAPEDTKRQEDKSRVPEKTAGKEAEPEETLPAGAHEVSKEEAHADEADPGSCVDFMNQVKEEGAAFCGDLAETPAKEQTAAEAKKDKPAKRFWPFARQTRQ